MPMTGRLILLKLAAGRGCTWLSACRRRAALRNPPSRVRQLDLANRALEPLVRRQLPPHRDDPDDYERQRRVVDRLPLELRARPRPAGGRERKREAENAD